MAIPNFQFSASALQSLKTNARKIHQPSEGFGGSVLTDQELCSAFNSAGEGGKSVKLIDYVCNDEATNRLKSTTLASGDKITSVNATSLQQVGRANIEVEVNGVKVTREVKMHSVVALSFVENESQMLIGTTGEITSGKNGPKDGAKGKLWLSLRLPVQPSEAQIVEWTAKVATAQNITLQGA